MSGILPTLDCVVGELDILRNKEVTASLYSGNEDSQMEKYYIWSSQHARGVHGIPNGYDVVTLRELVSLRINHCISMLQKAQINLSGVGANLLATEIRSRATHIMNHISPLWQRRLKTATALYHTHKSSIHIIDVPTYAFRLPENSFNDIGGSYTYKFLNYDDVSDGGVRALDDIEGNVYGRLSWDQYISSPGGNKTLLELNEHPVVKVLIPDAIIRQQYLTCLGVFDILGNYDIGNQSLWLPQGMDPGYLRWFDLGIKADAFYPPNCTTTGHHLLLKKSY